MGVMPAKHSSSKRPYIAMVSTHGYVAAHPPLGAADTGGQVVFVLELSRKLAQLGYDVDIWTRRFENQPEIDVVDAHVRVVRVPCGGNDFIPKEYLHQHLMEWCENALRYIRRNRLTYQFVNSHYWDGGIAGQRLAESLGIRHVHTPHSLGLWKKRQMESDYPEESETFEKEFNFKVRVQHERLLYAHASLVVATTPLQFDMLVNKYQLPAAKVPMIPPGYDDNRFFPVSDASRQMLRRKLGLKGNVIYANGRLATNKGYDLLINAFAVVAKRLPDAVLHLAAGGGSLGGNERKILAGLKRQVRKLGLQRKVKFVGFVPDNQLADYYRAADVFVLSSRYEPFGMTAIEAMACGTPTVITIHGGLYRAVSFGRHALYADPLDPEDLGIMIVKPLRHPGLRSRLSRMGAHKARSLFTWTGIAQQLISLVEQRPTLTVLTDSEWDEPWNDGD